jgi:hypothetical protein
MCSLGEQCECPGWAVCLVAAAHQGVTQRSQCVMQAARRCSGAGMRRVGTATGCRRARWVTEWLAGCDSRDAFVLGERRVLSCAGGARPRRSVVAHPGPQDDARASQRARHPAAEPLPTWRPNRGCRRGGPEEGVPRRRRPGLIKSGPPRQAQRCSGAVRAGRKLLRGLPPQRFDAHHGEGNQRQDHEDLAEVVDSRDEGQPE